MRTTSISTNLMKNKDIISLGYPGLYSNLDSFLNDPEYLSYPLGEFFENPEPGEINAQFMPGLSALLAVGYDIGGLPVMLRVNALVAVFCLLALYYFTRRFFGENAALFALLFLAICPAQIWAARITLTEILAQFLFFLAPLAICLFFCYFTSVNSAYYMLIAIAISGAVHVLDYRRGKEKEAKEGN